MEYCSGKALSIVNNQIIFQADKCANCEVCIDVCPVGALWIETLDYEELSEMTEKRFKLRLSKLGNGMITDTQKGEYLYFDKEFLDVILPKTNELLNELADENEQLKQHNTELINKIDFLERVIDGDEE